ncbi:hypothetical protein [Senegalimassilia anaerobia]
MSIGIHFDAPILSVRPILIIVKLIRVEAKPAVTRARKRDKLRHASFAGAAPLARRGQRAVHDALAVIAQMCTRLHKSFPRRSKLMRVILRKRQAKLLHGAAKLRRHLRKPARIPLVRRRQHSRVALINSSHSSPLLPQSGNRAPSGQAPKVCFKKAAISNILKSM